MKLFLATALSAMFMVPVLFGQGAVGTLNGTVTDPAGAVIPGASVVAHENATGLETKTTSTSSGDYTLPYLPSGTYTVRVAAPGFKTTTAENITLRVAQSLNVDIKMQLGTVNEQIVVNDQPAVLESDSAEIGHYITTAEYQSWPILVDDGQRQIQQFIFDSLPGTTGNTFQGSINGGQQYSHEILIEGIPVGRADLSGGNNNEFSPSAEAIGEFKLQTGVLGAEYNGGQTAVANFTIKSGTNNLHGTGFYYLGNEAFDSIPVQNKTFGGTNPRNRLNNWGYSVGGPVYIPKVYHGRNKTFFFTNLEKTATNNLVFNGFTTLPVPDFRNGNFSGLFDPAYTGNAKSGTTVGTDPLGRPIVFGQIYNPATTRTVNGAIVRDPFPGNIIPQSAWDPVAVNVLNKIGLPNPQFNSMLRNEQKLGTCCPYFHEWIVGVKIDHNINERNRISGYYNQSNRDRNNSCPTDRYLPVPGLPTSCWQEQITPGNMVRLSYTSTLSPSLVNRFAAGYNRFLNENGAPPGTLNQNYAGQIGLQNLPGTLFPKMTFSGNEYQGGTIAQIGVGSSDYAPNGSYVFQDDLTWIRGKHSFKFGYDYTRYYYTDRALSDAGAFIFTPRSTDLPGYLNDTGHAFASFLLGAVNSASHNIVGYTSGFRQPYDAMYAMDDWKVTPRLTLNLGLRWEIIPPFYEVTNRMSEINLTTPNPGAGNLPGALVFSSQVNNTFWKQIDPRAGMAFKISDKMIVRAGYGIMNTPPIANNWGYPGFSFGYNGTVNVPAGTSPTGFIDNPALYLNQPFPSLASPLPNKDPSSANFTQGATTAPNANRPGYVQNWDFTIQYELPKETLLEVAYIGNKGTRLWGGTPGSGFSEYDALPSRLLSAGDVLNDPVSLHPQYSPYKGFPTDQTVSQALRPYPQYLGVEEQFPYNTNSDYQSVQVTVTHHLTNGLGFLGAYTWSKAIGYIDSNGPAAYYATVQDYYNRGLERSVASFNVPQNLKLTWVYETPFGKGRRWDLHWANPILGGWQISANQNYSSGFAIAVTESGLNVPPGFAPNIRPDIVPGQQLTVGGVPSHVDVQDPTPYLNPSAFTLSPLTANGTPLRVGTAPRYLPATRGPAVLSEKLRIAKKFYLGEEHRFFEIAASMTNPLKRTVPYVSDTTVGDASFGTLLLGGGDRVMQLNARFEF